MRLLLLLCALVGGARAAVPAELAAALKPFRTDGPRGWAFTQATQSGAVSFVERFDPAQRDLARWKLLRQNGHAATPEEQRDYVEDQRHQAQGTTAPKLTEQFDLHTLETVAITAERTTYRCQLIQGETDDKTAAFLRVTFVLHRPTRTIESLEIANIAGFSPTFGVKISEMKTVLTYSLPATDRPSLPQKVTTHLRGRAFWVKSLDADMTVTFSDYAKAGKQ